tara:strand:+ start:549 stop:854 length:306 start_codon:yes stop_codon:yes gene_type:complete
MIHAMGFLLGLIIATTGAWKDTLFEDFSITKFFRSPIVTECWYLFLVFAFPGQPILLILLSSAALERLSVETYKALRRQPPGKFKRPTKDRGWLLERLLGK